MNIDTSLLREKFIIRENTSSDSEGKPLEIIAPSNRMPISLQTGQLPPESFVIRTRNMHGCTRMVAQIISDYKRHGPITPRIKTINWHELWDNCLSSYERLHIPERWVSVYHNGKRIFSEGDFHSFLDIIEQCESINKKEYEYAIELAKNAFTKTGRDVSIEYDSNVALVTIAGKKESRCSMVLRGPDKTTTFNYTVRPKREEETIKLPQVLSSAGDFLEGVQLSYMIGMNNEKIEMGLIERYGEEGLKTKAARARINELYAQINSMENRYVLRYRPERPDFDFIISETEKFAEKFLKEQQKKKSAL